MQDEITLEQIFADLRADGLVCRDPIPICGGWLNKIWKVSTDEGAFLIKLYSPKRYAVSEARRLERAFQYQQAMYERGISCPELRMRDGKALRILHGERMYAVMRFSEGIHEDAATATTEHLLSLGDVCGRMHKEFASFPASVKESDALRDLRNHVREQKQMLSDTSPAEFRNALCLAEEIADTWKDDVFSNIPRGITHEDFTSANILFTGGKVSAVLDFDRICTSYVWHDVGRAILCFALEENGLNDRKLAAFLEGYNRYLPLRFSDLADALRITFCIEATWWFRESLFTTEHGKATKFKDETVWLAEHLKELENYAGL